MAKKSHNKFIQIITKCYFTVHENKEEKIVKTEGGRREEGGEGRGGGKRRGGEEGGGRGRGRSMIRGRC